LKRRIKIKYSNKGAKRANNRFNTEDKISAHHTKIIEEQKPNYEQKIELNAQIPRKQNFLLAFVNAFNFGSIAQRKPKQNNTQDFFNMTINDFNSSFKKLKNNYARERN